MIISGIEKKLVPTPDTHKSTSPGPSGPGPGGPGPGGPGPCGSHLCKSGPPHFGSQALKAQTFMA